MIAMLLCSALLAQVPTPSPAPVTGQQTQQEIWDKRCKLCHGEDGKSQTKKGKQLKAPNFTSDRWQKHTTDDEIVKAVTNGITKKGKKRMPSFKEKLSPDEIKSMVQFLRAFATK